MYGALIAILSLAALPGEIIDRIAVTVGPTAITESRILDEIRVIAFLNGVPPDLSAASKREAADRLVERALLRQEIVISGFDDSGAPETDEMMAGLIERFGGEQEFRNAMLAAGLTEEKVRSNVKEQALLLGFIDFRFRPAVTVAEAEVEEFYQGAFKRDWGSTHTGGQPPPLDEVREEIENLLTERRIDQTMDDWLKTARTQYRILYREEAFRE